MRKRGPIKPDTHTTHFLEPRFTKLGPKQAITWMREDYRKYCTFLTFHALLSDDAGRCSLRQLDADVRDTAGVCAEVIYTQESIRWEISVNARSERQVTRKLEGLLKSVRDLRLKKGPLSKSGMEGVFAHAIHTRRRIARECSASTEGGAA